MLKKKRQITDFQFKLGLTILILLIIIIFYFVFVAERFTIKEDSIGQEPLLEKQISYNTEFCANRLTELAHEIHFLEKEIISEKEILGAEGLVKDQEQKVITIEQRELQEVKDEFEKYKSICDQFDENPTSEICVTFLQEAKDKLDIAQKNVDESTGLKHIEITLKELRNTKRIYEGMNNICDNLK
ncbi:hypothetical protein COV12_04145 [Candidatus Woesearchaeota archaeon CG10_big_fil_rev_8_21_14_0_10_32_24]|nr:MAG: hypothetical protein COV12_04145 [Candidatus Woesearchaeota archaeon CG10_big_fil_rev_8_21_14_0_10_32_24]